MILLVVRRPRRPTLFPYTTLFRSQGLPRHLPSGGHARRLRRRRVAQADEHFRAEPLGHVENRDRKSTRLNSSHTVISYAVFCLKKKKEKRRYNSARTSDTNSKSRTRNT